MEKKVYIIENLDCANCAAKIEEKMNRHPQIAEAVLTYATGQLRITAEDPDALLPELTAIARSVEAEAVILPREQAEEQHHSHHHEHGADCCCGHDHDHAECGCGHDHHHKHEEEHHHIHDQAHHDHGSEEDHDHGAMAGRTLLIGAGLFAAGVLLGDYLPRPAILAIYLCAYGVLGREVVETAVKNLVRGHVFDENFLMSLATVGAFLIGEYPEAVGVMLFYQVGEYFEHRAVERSRSQIMEAVDLRPEVVQLVADHAVTEAPAGQVRVGDRVLVRPGDRIPLDGVVISGRSRIDTAPITGEPVPVSVKEGDKVTSGCVNLQGQIILEVEKPLSESMVTRILDSVENAAASKPKIDRFITRFARVYTPTVVLGAAAVAIIPALVTGNWGYWFYTALTFLVMSCPCALVLSVPLAFFAGIGAGSKQGILFKGGVSMEAMSKVKTVVLDKTGTVTRGDFRVQQILGDDHLLAVCAACEQHSSHPIAQSITEAALERGLSLEEPEQLEELAGRGIRASLKGQQILCGNDKLLKEANIACPKAGDYGTTVYVAVDGRYLGHLLIADTVKPGAENAIRRLRDSGISTVMLTGDAEHSARSVAGKVGISEVYASLLPQQKLERLRTIRKEKGAAMFVGDGINDAPVLAGADVGAAMGSGADAAIEAADVVFLTSDVEAIPQALEIARQTRQVAWQNVVFALAVKLAVMILGILGHASMWMAVFADSGVAMLCVLNSVRMLYIKQK